MYGRVHRMLTVKGGPTLHAVGLSKVTIKVITIEVQKVIAFAIIISVKGATYGQKRQQENYGLL